LLLSPRLKTPIYGWTLFRAILDKTLLRFGFQALWGFALNQPLQFLNGCYLLENIDFYSK